MFMPCSTSDWVRAVFTCSVTSMSDTFAVGDEAGMAATRQLAKRQLTWLRSMPDRHTVACDSLDATDRVMQRVATLWGHP
jgi:tRNA A37 N6-isopentenylltransferase MiaA